jgi:hypothetical protein
MPLPQDVTTIQRLLGLAQYLSKFLPHLSDITKLLRELTQKDTVWDWGQAQQLRTLEESQHPVHPYYSTTMSRRRLHCNVMPLRQALVLAEWSASRVCLEGTDSYRNTLRSN